MHRLTTCVLIPTFNRAHLLTHSLNSMLRQTRPPDRIVVVDDGSTDATPALLETYRDQLVVVRIAKGGKAAASNAGLERVETDCVWIFDDDDVAVPDALERLHAPLERDPSIGFSIGNHWYTRSGPDGTLEKPHGVSSIPDLVSRGPLLPLLEANYLGGARVYARRACYEVLGGFDPSLVRSQDYEWAIRLVRRFTGVPAAGGPTYHYRQHHDVQDGNAATRDLRRVETWRAFDQAIFRRAYADLPLHEYLAPGCAHRNPDRLALLQRSGIMATKDLVEEAIRDLRAIAAGPDQTELTAMELSIVRGTLLQLSWYGRGMPSFPEFRNAVVDMARRSPVMKQILAVAIKKG